MDLPTTVAPIPGSPATIRSHASRFARTADSILEAVEGLRTAIADTRANESAALDQLATNASATADRLSSLENRYRVASSAVSDFATALETAQTQAAPLVDQSGDAVNNLGYTNGRIRELESQRWTTTDPTELVALNEQLITLHQRRRTHEGTISTAQTRFNSILDTLRQAGSNAAARLSRATDGDGFNDSILDNIIGWVQENAEILKAIRQVLQIITAALAVLSFVFPVLAPFALAAGLLTAGLSLLLATAGEISWVDFALDVLAVATFGVGAVASRALGRIVQLMRANRIGVMTNALPQLTTRGYQAANRVVTNQFNNVLNGALNTVKTPIPFVRLGPGSPEWARRMVEVITARGSNNADFLRLLNNPTVTGRNATIDLLTNVGQMHQFLTVTMGRVNLVAQQGDALLGDHLPRLAELLPEGWAVTEGIEGISDWYTENVHEASTWRVNS